MMDESRCELKLPGFRFHPTEEELLNFYLKSMVFGKKLRGDIIGLLNIYNYDPRELPGKIRLIYHLFSLGLEIIVVGLMRVVLLCNETGLAKIGEREWYFFVPRDRKHGSGGRPNRTTENGFWKATGSDKQIVSLSDPKKILGLKKTLVFYQGRAPRGKKTEWIMNEYRLPDKCSPPKDIVLCKIYMKATSLKVLEQRAAMEEEIRTYTSMSPVTPPLDSVSFCCDTIEDKINVGFKKEKEETTMMMMMNPEEEESNKGRACSSLVLPNGILNLAELQVPKFSSDWSQDSFWAQFSPWLDNFTPFIPMC
ncbi:hypothetical protein ACS0TY_004142 [Phlomoides rotata]